MSSRDARVEEHLAIFQRGTVDHGRGAGAAQAFDGRPGRGSSVAREVRDGSELPRTCTWARGAAHEAARPSAARTHDRLDRGGRYGPSRRSQWPQQVASAIGPGRHRGQPRDVHRSSGIAARHAACRSAAQQRVVRRDGIRRRAATHFAHDGGANDRARHLSKAPERVGTDRNPRVPLPPDAGLGFGS